MGNLNTRNFPVESLPTISNITQPDFDVARFAGGFDDHWYEVARIDNPLETRCLYVSHTIRSAMPDLSIITACYENVDARPTFVQRGTLRIENPGDPSKMLMVTEKWLQLGRGVNFWVYDTDYENYAIVGNQQGMAWLLSRRKMECCRFLELRERMREIGFDIARENFHVNFEYIECARGSSRAEMAQRPPPRPEAPLPQRPEMARRR